MTSLDIALRLAAQGYPVFPLCEGKRPLAGSRGHLDATTDPSALRDLWRRRPGGALVGIATGEAAGLDVLDFDLPRHASARWWWHRYRTAIPPTRITMSRSGGLHVWFRAASGLRCSQGRVFPGIDVRATGGFVAAWFAFGCEVIEDNPPASWPEWLLSRARPRPEAPPRPARRAPRPDGADALICARAAGVLQTITASTEGTRNSALFWAACRFAELAAAGAIDRAEAERLLVDAATGTGLTSQEARRTIRSAIAGGGR